jgi:hypothetical protein
MALAAQKQSQLVALVVFLVPFAAIVYGVRHWDEQKAYCIVVIFGYVLLGIGLAATISMGPM